MKLQFLNTLYFIGITVSVGIFFFGLKAKLIKLVSFSTVLYLYAFATILPYGYKIAAGDITPNKFSAGFNIDLYILYMFHAVMLPLGLISGNFFGRYVKFRTSLKRNTRLKVNILIFACIFYAIVYFLWLPVIPLKSLILNGFSEAYLDRIYVTHQFGKISSIPFLFRYHNLILRGLLFLLYLMVLSFYIKGVRKIGSDFWVMIFSGFVLFCFIYTLEKSQGIVFLSACIFLIALDKKIELKHILLSGLIVLAAIHLELILLNDWNFYDLHLTMDYLFGHRLPMQSSSTYLQMQYLEDNGFLYFSGIRVPILHNFIGYVDFSKEAMKELAPNYSAKGLVGAAGGSAIVFLYICFSWFAVPLFFIFSFLYGCFDRVMIGAMHRSIGWANIMNKAFYAYIVASFYYALGSNVFAVFSVPFFVSPLFALTLIVYLSFFRVRLILNCYSLY